MSVRQALFLSSSPSPSPLSFSSEICGSFIEEEECISRSIKTCSSTPCNRFFGQKISDNFREFVDFITLLLTKFFLRVWSYRRTRHQHSVHCFVSLRINTAVFISAAVPLSGIIVDSNDIIDIFSVRVFVQSGLFSCIFSAITSRGVYTQNYCSCYRHQKFLGAV